MKRLLSVCLLALFLGLLWNYLFNYHISHSLLFWERCAKETDAWADKLHSEQSPCYVFVGGSETRTTVDPEYLLQQYGIRAINAAEQAGYTMTCNFEAATKYLRKGDTLIISYPIANIDNQPSKVGLQFLWKRKGLQMFEDGLIQPNYSNIRALVIGDGGTAAFTLIKGLFCKESIYSYDKLSCVHSSGWMEVRRERPISLLGHYSENLRVTPLTSEKLSSYQHLQECCMQHGVSLLFRTHLEYRDESFRAVHALHILNLVRAGFKVIKEERMGCESDRKHFSDTINHLSAYGTRIYMQELGKALLDQSVWTEKELIEKLREYGRDAEGNPL